MRSAARGRRSPEAQVFLRLTPRERTRFKVAAAETGQTYAQFVMAAVERHETKSKRAGAVARSPLHDVEDFDIDE